MGRPLYSTLVAPAEPVVHVAEVETPTCERWNYVNAFDPAFDPDTDESFEGNVVYEAFLTAEEVAQREQERRISEATQQAERVRANLVGVRSRIVQSLRTARARTRDAVDGIPDQNAEQQHPELVEDDSSSSEGSSSGRVSPAEITAGFASQLEARRGDLDLSNSRNLEQEHEPDSPSANPRHSISLPGSPPYAPQRLLDSLLASADLHEDLHSFLARSAPIPIQHSPQNTSTVMTPPGSVTPRFLNWSSRPRAIPMSPSPTPDAPLGSIRASRMVVSYIAPPRPSVGVQL